MTLTYIMGQPKGEDKYIRAKEIAGKTDNTMKTAQLGILSAGIVAGQMAESMAEKILAGKKAAAAIERHKGKATFDESQKNLEDIAEDVEERCEDAVNPEEKKATESSSATGAKEDAGIAENETNTDTGEAVDADTTLTPKQDTDSADKSVVPENTTAPLAPTQPSVDIIV